MDTTQIIVKYGGADLALQRMATLSIVGRALTEEETAEMSAIQSVADELRGVVALAPLPPVKQPLDWWRQKGGKWDRVCLAASLHGWDPFCEESPNLSEDKYDAALSAADAHMAAVVAAHSGPASKSADSTAGRRAFILTHPENMAAVIAYRPQPMETIHMLNTVRGSNESGMNLTTDQRSAVAMTETWNRVLWPAGAQAQAIMDNDPGGYAVGYPMAYWRAIGLNTRDVRGK